MARKASTSSRATVLDEVASWASAGVRNAGNEKLTMSMPAASRNSRRFDLPENIGSLSGDAGSALDGAHYAKMSTTPAKVVGQCLLDLSFAWTLVIRQESCRFHDHAVDAIATLGRLVGDKGLLNGC